MASIVETTFVLTGAREGQTVRLGDLPYPFVDGRLTISCAVHEIACHALFLERNWQAYPEGHAKLKELLNGKRNLQTDKELDPESKVSGDVLPNGQGPAAGDSPAVGEGPAEPESGQAESLPEGDRQPEVLVLAEPDFEEKNFEHEINQKLLRAVMSLDKDVDSNWTKDGHPSVTAVERAYGSSAVTRADIEAVAPGYRRGAV